jgi:hypothetical protein
MIIDGLQASRTGSTALETPALDPSDMDVVPPPRKR